MDSKLFDACIKWAMKQGFEPNYECTGKWHMQDDGITWSNKKVFEEFMKTNTYKKWQKAKETKAA